MAENKVEKLKKKLEETCTKTETSLEGMKLLVDYYIKNLKWTEEKAYEYALGLFKNGTIEKIKFFGKDNKEIK